MSNSVRLADFIEKQIAGCWGEPNRDRKNQLEVLCVRGTDLSSINLMNFDRVPRRFIPNKQSNRLLGQNSIIIEVSGGSSNQSTGRVGFISSQAGNIVCSNFCRGLVIREGYDARFFYYVLQNVYNSNIFFNYESKTTGIKNLLINTAFENILVPKFHLDTQKIISEVLSQIDAKIELNQKINAELESMAKLIYDYWFVQFDFPDENGKPYKTSGGKMVYNEVLNIEIPEGWVCANLSSITNLNPSLSIPKGHVASHLDMRSIPEMGYMTELPIKKEFKGGVKFQNGDVVIARITPCLENGKTAFISLLDNDEIGFGSTEFIVLRGVNPDYYSFLAFLARSVSFRTFAISKMTGTSGRRRVSASDIGEYKLAFPTDLTLFSRFNKLVMPKLKLMTSNTKENDALSKSRDWLLPMLMNGQVTIKD